MGKGQGGRATGDGCIGRRRVGRAALRGMSFPKRGSAARLYQALVTKPVAGSGTPRPTPTRHWPFPLPFFPYFTSIMRPDAVEVVLPVRAVRR